MPIGKAKTSSMGKILIAEGDAVFGAVLEDRLHVVGHQVESLSSQNLVINAAARGPSDLLILAIDSAEEEALSLIEALKSQLETRTLPILVLAESDNPTRRLAILRAGADEVLGKPCDLEELMIRAERLIGSRTALEPVLHGNLANHPCWGLMQYLRQAAKSGELVLRGASFGGRIRVQRGEVVSAKCGHLRKAEALLALLGLKEGRFRFTSQAESVSAEETTAGSPAMLVSIDEVLLQTAWFEDELKKRDGYLPVTGTPLSATDQALPKIEEEQFTDLPLAEIHQRVSAEPGLRVHDLIKAFPLAPQKIRLAVAWLVEKGVLAPPEGREHDSFPTTTEITSSMLIDIAVSEFLGAAKTAGFSTTALPFLILAEPSVWPVLLKLIQSVPGYQGNDALHVFFDQLRLRNGGSIAFESELGKLSLHAQSLTEEARPRIESVVTACAGVLIWLDEGAEEDLVRGVVERLEKVRGGAAGMMVATQAPVRELAEKLMVGTQRWRVSTHAPQSLLGVLRLLQPTVKK